MAKIRELSILQRLSLTIGIFLFRLLALTLKVHFTDRAKELFENSPRSHLILLWHNRLALALIVFSRAKTSMPLTGLVSASGDGAFLAEVMRAFNIRCARGSSSRRSVEATRELLQALDDERNIVITPDGPRGPRYVVKEGTATIAQTHVKGTCVVGLSVSAFWEFNSWDSFILPKPFSTVTVDMIRQEDPITRESLEKALLANNS